MQSFISRVLVFPVLNNANPSLRRILATKHNNVISPLQATIKTTDTTIIYTATRVLLKEIYGLEFKDTLDAISQAGSNFWMDETFRHWLIKFVEADYYDNYDDKTHIFIVPIDEEISEIHNKDVVRLTETELKEQSPQDYTDYCKTKELYEEAEKDGTLKYYGIINCEIQTSWRNHYEALYCGIFRQKGERWLNYAAADSHFPTDDDLKKLKGLVFSGAGHASYDESITWHNALKEFIRKAFYNYPSLKLLGVCFGCQMLAHTLGGRTEKMKGLDVSFITDLAYVKLLPEMKEKRYYKTTLEQLSIGDVDKFVAVEAHGDHVALLPQDAQVLAHSETTEVEMWGLGDKILGVQFHPEFNEPLMKGKVLEELEEEEEMKLKMKAKFIESEKNHELHRTFQVNLCKNFLKS